MHTALPLANIRALVHAMLGPTALHSQAAGIIAGILIRYGVGIPDQPQLKFMPKPLS